MTTPANDLQHGTSKQELDERAERTRAGKYFTPPADIFETKDALSLVLDMPGVAKDQVHVRLENDQLEIEGRVAVAGIQGQEAVYSEYNVGHYYRRFTLSNKIAKDRIEATMEAGVLRLVLPKVPEATPRRIAVH
jgi:HSP20 family molecular chaperone IbpA